MPVGAGSPEIPDYNQFEGSKQRWRDLVGYYTRYGDMRELLREMDDRYVIMNSGDEMSFRFAEQPPPPAGWVRDYVIKGDGWIKDGDYNSTFSKTVLPLPYHAKNEYTTRRAGWRMSALPATSRGLADTFQTRYVTPEVFKNALRGELATMTGNRIARIILGIFFVALLVSALVHQAHFGRRESGAIEARMRRHPWHATDFICRKFLMLPASISFISRRSSIPSLIPSCRRSHRWARRSRSSISIATVGRTFT